MEIDLQTKQDALVVWLRGRVDTVSAPELAKKTDAALQQEQKKWVFDLSGLEYISSAGLRVFLGTAKSLKAGGGELRLAAAVPAVHKVLRIAGLLSLFKYFDRLDDALEAF